MSRMYPDSVAYHADEPTSNNFIILGSDKSGAGIATRKNFKKGDLVFRFDGELLTTQTLHTLQIVENLYLHDPYAMGLVLHSCDPNMVADMSTQRFYAVKDIMAGEYLTMDYDSTEDVLHRTFMCQCGYKHCRGEIRGRKNY